MNLKEQQFKYADVILGAGVALQKDQWVQISCPIELKDFAEVLTEAALKKGAKDVYIDYVNPAVKRLRYRYCTEETLTNPPEFYLAIKKHFIDHSAAIINLYQVRDNEYGDIDPNLVLKEDMAFRKLLHEANRFMFRNQCTFAMIMVPDQKWADLVFPNEKNNLEKLWEYVGIACRTNQKDPVGSWMEHYRLSNEHADKIAACNFRTLRYKNSLGTDFTVGIRPEFTWGGGGSIKFGDKIFFPNMPTEEIGTAPDRLSANGILYASRPLVENGQLIEDFWMRFHNGKVVDFGAKKGYESLKAIITHDENSCYLGEVALVSADSPIASLKTTFYNTLFDENASCHFALGNAYTDCIPDGRGKPKEWLLEHGLNVSDIHVDFMVGTDDLDIVGIDENGKETYIFKNGVWAI